MAPASLFLLLLDAASCAAFGFAGCAQNVPDSATMWCSSRRIANLSEVLSRLPGNTTRIVLSHNLIWSVQPGSFGGLVLLRDLDLSWNWLTGLVGGEFRGLSALEHLNLTRNNISHLHSGALYGLSSLRSLILAQNRIVQISPGLLDFVPQIQVLNLSLNRLQTFSCAHVGRSPTLRYLELLANELRSVNVSGFPSLEYLTLSNNSKLRLHAQNFADNPSLRFLFLTRVRVEELVGLSSETKRNLVWVSFSLRVENSPFSICCLIEGMENLDTVQVDLMGSGPPLGNSSLLECSTPRVLILADAHLGGVPQLSSSRQRTSKIYLSDCGIEKVSRSTFGGYQGLEMLQMNRNLPVLDEDAFHDLGGLQLLSFDRSRMREVNPKWFVPLRNLTCLSLKKNEIMDLLRNSFSPLRNLEQLYLHFNLLKYITKQPFGRLRKLKKLNLSFNIIDFIEDGSFRDLTSLGHLDLSGNRIMIVTPSILSGLSNLKTLYLYSNRLSFRAEEAPFSNMSSLEFLDMNYQGPGTGGIGTIGPRFFQGTRRLVNVMIGHGNSIQFHPDAFGPLSGLRSLYISGMKIQRTNLSQLMRPLLALKKLILLRMDLDTLPPHLLPEGNSLEILKLQYNHLRTVDRTRMEELPRLIILDVTGNPLTCTCDNAWFKSWAVHDPQVQVSFLYDLRCDNDPASPLLWRLDDSACSYDAVCFTLFAGTSALDAVLLLACLLWRANGASLRYLLLMARARLRGRRRAGAGAARYDAFVSYSSRDEAWVTGQLVTRLERRGLRLCLHHRDFLPGAAILENIESAVFASRHTLCVVTRHFLRSEWCAVEFQLASLRLLCDGSDVLLLVFLEDIPEHRLSPYTRLRKLVRRKTFLLWPALAKEQEAFWVRLGDALKGGREEEEEEEEEERGGRGKLLTPLIG